MRPSPLGPPRPAARLARRLLTALAALVALTALGGTAWAQIEEEDIPTPSEPAVPAPPAPPAPGTSMLLGPSPATLVAEAERRYSEGDLEGAAELYRQAGNSLPAGDERNRLLVVLATLELHLGRADVALQTLSSVLIAKPDFPVQAENYGADFVNLYFEARKRAIEERGRQAEERTRLALEQMEQGNLAAARGLLAEALVLRPNYPVALYDLALVAGRSGDEDGAIGGFQKLLALGANAADPVPTELRGRALQSVGILYYNRGFYEDAESHLAQATAIDPGNAGVWNNLGLARRRLGKTKDATAAFRRAYELERNDQAVINNLALAYMDAGNHLEAVGLLAETAARFPENPALWLNLGIANRGLANPDGAVRALRKAIELDPDDRLDFAGRAATFLALTLLDQGDAAGALTEAKRALAWRPEDVQAWTYLGLAQQALNDLDGARVSLERAQTLDPTSAEIANNLGSVYFRLGSYDAARALFERALQMRPDFLAASENLAHANKRLAELAVLRTRLGMGTLPPPPAPGEVQKAGVLVVEIVPGGPAARAGLLVGDRIVAAERVPLASPSTLFALLERETDLRALSLEVIRGGKQSRMKLRLTQ